MQREIKENSSVSHRFRRTSWRVFENLDIRRLVESELRNSETYEGFCSKLQTEIDTLIGYTGDSDRHKLEQESVKTFSGRESAIPKHVLKILQKLSEVTVLNVTDNRRSIGRDEAQMLLNLKTQRGGQGPLKRIQEIVSSLLGVQIDAFSGEQMTRIGDISAELDVDDFVVEVNGSGIKEALRLLLDIEFQAPDLLLVEEPEIHLHPALETNMMHYLKEVSQNRQVFITTHSTNFLDTVSMKNIYLVSKTAESTIAQLLNQGEVEEQIPIALGIRLSSLFIYDRLIFVESQTDEDIIRAWASTLDVNLSQLNVGFIHMGGARNLSYFASGSTLSFLAKRQVKMWFLIDRDERDEEDIKVIQEYIGDNAVSLIFQKREIENYLIHPRIMINQIAIKLSKSGDKDRILSDTEKIETLIGKAVDNLKQITIFKRVAKSLCRPLYPNRKHQLECMDGKTVEEKITEQIEAWETKVSKLRCAIDEETEKQTQEVENCWEEHKLDIVPGDLLIDMVYRHYEVRFRKEHGDGVELARMMTKDDIDPELEKLIKSIGT